jgi:hypothetical protein
VKPLTCLVANWWDSFDREGWSNCSDKNLFITGFFRNHELHGHLIYVLEYTRCCSSIPAFKGQSGDCKIANWWTSLDRYNNIMRYQAVDASQLQKCWYLLEQENYSAYDTKFHPTFSWLHCKDLKWLYNLFGRILAARLLSSFPKYSTLFDMQISWVRHHTALILNLVKIFHTQIRRPNDYMVYVLIKTRVGVFYQI